MSKHGKMKQIMVVDDEALTLTLMGIVLQRRGFTVIDARDAGTALHLLERTTPDLFILDVMMPGMDGIELTRRIRSRPQTARTPILLVSAQLDPRGVQRGLEAGANEFLSKLISHLELLKKVNLLLGIEQEGYVS